MQHPTIERLLQHVQLAVTPERLPLGVIAATTWGRDPEDPRKAERRKQMPFEQKESYRWLQGYRQACVVAEQVPGTQIVAISDREGDIYECFVAAAEVSGPRADWIIRASQDRSLSERSEATQEFPKLRATVAARTALGRLRLRLPRSGGARPAWRR
jgi:hypothetical protein